MIEHILFKITEEEEEEDESAALDAPPFGTWAHKIFRFGTCTLFENEFQKEIKATGKI